MVRSYMYMYHTVFIFQTEKTLFSLSKNLKDLDPSYRSTYSPLNNLKDLDPSYKTDLDHRDRFERENPIL